MIGRGVIQRSDCDNSKRGDRNSGEGMRERWRSGALHRLIKESIAK
jgi:hypothetical protein